MTFLTLTFPDEVGPLEDFVEPGQLRMMLKRQLEYYFSRFVASIYMLKLS